MVTAFVIGNIASGKSTAARYLASRGGHHIDLDVLAKSLYEPGSPLVASLADTFGDEVINTEGGIDSAALARSAFATPESVQRLNALVYPELLQKLVDMLVEPVCCVPCRVPYRFHVVEISVAASFQEAFPLADEIIAITAPRELRRIRAIERGMSGSDFDRRADAQPSEAELCALATLVIDNSAAEQSLFSALDEWLATHGFLNNQERLV